MTTGPIQVALQVADACEACGLLYLVGGSVASSLGGEPRTTLDVDMVVDMTEPDIDGFLAALGSGFYADEEAIRRAIRQRSSVNLIHRASAIKVDVFISGGTPLDQQQIGRRRRVQVSANPDRYLYVHTPEDILLQKLRWFRLGNEASDRKWRDVLGILLVQGGALDREYLRRGAETLGVADRGPCPANPEGLEDGSSHCGTAPSGDRPPHPIWPARCCSDPVTGWLRQRQAF